MTKVYIGICGSYMMVKKWNRCCIHTHEYAKSWILN